LKKKRATPLAQTPVDGASKGWKVLIQPNIISVLFQHYSYTGLSKKYIFYTLSTHLDEPHKHLPQTFNTDGWDCFKRQLTCVRLDGQLVADADLFWEKSSIDWFLVADLFWEKSNDA
jgi:hypothetical protein